MLLRTDESGVLLIGQAAHAGSPAARARLGQRALEQAARETVEFELRPA